MVERRHIAQGFTLIELLISALILGVGLAAVAQLYLAASTSFHKAEYLSIATQRAQRELERVENFTFTQIDTAFKAGTLVPDRYPAPNQNETGYPYNGYYQTVEKQGTTVTKITVSFNMANELPGSTAARNKIIFTRFNSYTHMYRVEVQLDWGVKDANGNDIGRRSVQSPVDVITLITSK
jgi:prepilin-type N-terminal cleavage/methylation domain-containing protein